MAQSRQVISKIAEDIYRVTVKPLLFEIEIRNREIAGLRRDCDLLARKLDTAQRALENSKTVRRVKKPKADRKDRGPRA